MAELKKGDRAPEFSLIDQDHNTVALSQFKGRKLLVYFYPRADTPGCTVQACHVRDAVPDFQRLEVAALGISPDKPERQKKFAERHGLNFPLLSDPDHAVATAWGTWGTRSLYGKLFDGVIRSSFLLDEQGVVIQAWYKVSPKDTVPKALQALGKG
jgi:peroxiredoxin Q/BCP